MSAWRIVLADDEPEVAAASHVQFGQRLLDVPLPEGLGDYETIMDELLAYTRVLKGLADSPVNSPYLALMEVASAYLARAYEIEMLIFMGEHTGAIGKGDLHYKLRTGPLDSFISMARRLSDLGSRRLSQEALLSDQRRTESVR